MGPSTRYLRDPTSRSTASCRSLTNVLKHAHASRAHVLIDRRPDHVSVEVVDDGRGAAAGRLPGETSGNGLRGIQERVAALGGTFQSGTVADQGFSVHAVLRTEEPT